MCLKPTQAATLAIALMASAIAQPVLAWPFGGASAKPAPAAGTNTSAQTAAPTDPKAATTSAKKASPEARAQADKLDPLTRVAFWTREVSIDPSDAQAGVGLASALRASGRLDEAADTAGRVLTLYPKSAPAMFELAKARISQSKGFYAIKSLLDLTAQDPRDVRPWTLLGIAYEQNEQPDLARAAYEQALKLSPDDTTALSNYALFRAIHGEPQVAEGMLRKAVAAPGAGPVQRQNLALVLGLEGKVAEAERLIRQDLPPESADADLAYLRAINGQPTAAAAVAGRSWGAVQASEAAQAKSPS